VTELDLALAVTDDAFLGGRLQVLQPKKGYRAGLDAVLLAAAAPLIEGRRARLLDIGAGVGVVGLSAARRIADAEVVLVERHPQLAELARANIVRNALSERVRLIEADVDHPLGQLPELNGLAESFDCVLANPPYHTEGRGTAAGSLIKSSAHAMPDGSLDRWARLMAAMATPGGSALVVHKAEALPEVLAAFSGRFGGLLVLPIYPRAGAEASRIIVCGRKGSRAPLRLCPGLVLHDADGASQPQVDAILREGAALALPP
jgi:tRNA1(Val) A37 N6-methylase TrmN6